MKSIALSNVDVNNIGASIRNKEVHTSIIDAISNMDSIAITGRIGAGKTRLYREILKLLSLSKHAEGYGAYTCIDEVGLDTEVEFVKKKMAGEGSREKQAVLFTSYYRDDTALLRAFPDFDGLHIHIN